MPKDYRLQDKPADDIKMLEPEATYSYADYLKWNFAERIELIKGKFFKMSPAPGRIHQELCANLHGIIWNFLREKSKKCRVYSAPFDVRFPENQDNSENHVYTVVQPDICVVCDESKLDDAGCIGAPDLIVEILSPSTASKDLKNKFELYEENGVWEYWVVYPAEKVIEVFRLGENNRYGMPAKFTEDDRIQSGVLTGLEMEMKDIFDR